MTTDAGAAAPRGITDTDRVPPGEPPVEAPGARRSRLGLAAVMLLMGTLHFLVPRPFMRLIPRWLGSPRAWVYASGVAELTSGALLLAPDPSTRRVGGTLAAVTIVGVYPGNIQMAVDAGPPRSVGSLAAWLRLPLQFPLLAWALRNARA